MDREYLAPHSVNVYADQAAKGAGTSLVTAKLVPYSMAGFDSYLYRGLIFEGYIDPLDPKADACIILKP